LPPITGDKVFVLPISFAFDISGRSLIAMTRNYVYVRCIVQPKRKGLTRNEDKISLLRLFHQPIELKLNVLFGGPSFRRLVLITEDDDFVLIPPIVIYRKD
jgi:hypothetical protein